MTTKRRDQPGTRAGPARDQPGTRGPAKSYEDKRANEDKASNASYEGAALRAILSDPGAPATAKVTAVRTLAEMNGLIGRHQPAPDRAAEMALSGLSRDDLIGELERLRLAVELGLLR